MGDCKQFLKCRKSIKPANNCCFSSIYWLTSYVNNIIFTLFVKKHSFSIFDLKSCCVSSYFISPWPSELAKIFFAMCGTIESCNQPITADRNTLVITTEFLLLVIITPWLDMSSVLCNSCFYVNIFLMGFW